MAKDNKSLGKFQLNGIPPAPRGVPQIEVSFDIDANGILKVSARDKGTGREQSVSITNTGGLSSTEIDRMRQEAEVYAEEDNRRKKLIELKNQADSLFYSYETTLRDNGEFIPDHLKTQAIEGVAELKAAIADSSITVEEMRQRLDSLQKTLLDIGASLYQRVSQPPDEDEGLGPDYDATVPFSPSGDDPTPSNDYSSENDATVTADYEAVD